MSSDGGSAPAGADGGPGSAGGAGAVYGNGNSNGGINMDVMAIPVYMTHRLRLNPNSDHKPDSYEDMQLDFSPLIFSSLERYLPANIIQQDRDVKVDYMREILLRYFPEKERTRIQKLREYRHKITSNYQRLHKELYNMQAENFFAPSFLRALNENTEQGFRAVMSEPYPGVFSFEMLQPKFCEMMIAEVDHIERWVHDTKFKIMRPNTINKFGVVLDDFGFGTMLDKLVEEFIRPIAKIFFPDVGGATLDAHHGFIVQYGIGRDVDMSFHIDDSEVTLNVCLGTQFSGGELFFRGIRCENHVNTETQTDEVFDYQQVPGCAVLHRGCHRHGAKSTSGSRLNFLLWCKSSVFRELRKYQKDFSSWCSECLREKRERQRQTVDATKLELLRRESQTFS